MSSQLQIFFNKAEETKHKIKELRKGYKQSLETSEEYKELTDKILTLREKKKQIEAQLKEAYSTELAKLDDLLIDLDSNKQMITDVAISSLMKGETVEVTDQYNNKYEPVFKVSFKKE